MNSNAAGTAEFDWQKALLFSEVGAPGSGAARYAAAMYFYNQARMSAEMLEIYRRCCKFDFEDPIDVAKYEGVTEIPPKTLSTLSRQRT
jgi:hypothetical protein